MKKSEIATIIFIAVISSMIAFLIASSLPFLKLPEQGVKVDSFQKIEADVKEPSAEVFNDKAINPTVTVETATTSP